MPYSAHCETLYNRRISFTYSKTTQMSSALWSVYRYRRRLNMVKKQGCV